MKLSNTLIYGLTASILLVSAPHAEHLHAWVLALCVILLAWRTYLTWAAKPLPSRWLLMSISVAGASGIFFSFHTLFGREAGVTLLILLATLKLLELRAMRDAMVLVFLANFIIITNFFYSHCIVHDV
jgi:cation transport ATPase